MRSLLYDAGCALLACVCLGLVSSAVQASPSAALSTDGGVCLECHDLDGALESQFPHMPITDGECVACHNPHVSRFAALLNDRPAVLCADCHSDTEVASTRAQVHKPFAEGRCNDCHQPHGSSFDGLLKMATAELCASCHSQSASWSAKAVQHTPFAQGRCASCHDPHAADFDFLASQDGARLCATCHQASAALRNAHRGYPVDRASCSTCHDPHASARRGLFRETLHEPFADGDCGTCHQASSASEPFALVEPVDQLCNQCHPNQREASIAASYPHVSAGGGGCVSCHNPHAGDGSAMLKSSTESVCLSCHDPGGAKSGEPLRFATHGEGVECTDCHSAHGGERPVLLSENAIDLCGACHTHEHSIRHPVGDGVIDPRTGSVMTCLSCHSIHEPGYEMYLHASDERDLCIGCHKDIVGGET